jgi:hypothetical protein
VVRGSEKEPEGSETKGGGNGRDGRFAKIEYPVSRKKGDEGSGPESVSDLDVVVRPSEMRYRRERTVEVEKARNDSLKEMHSCRHGVNLRPHVSASGRKTDADRPKEEWHSSRCATACRDEDERAT